MLEFACEENKFSDAVSDAIENYSKKTSNFTRKRLQQTTVFSKGTVFSNARQDQDINFTKDRTHSQLFPSELYVIVQSTSFTEYFQTTDS